MRGLELLHPEVRKAAEALQALAAIKGINVIITDTLRTQSEQNALYAMGRKPLHEVNKLRKEAKMSPISSKENKWRTNAENALDSYHGWGLAFDIVITGYDGKTINWSEKVDWNENLISDWEEVGSLISAIPGLEWGGNWTKYRDMPHFQMTMGKTIAQLKKERLNKL